MADVATLVFDIDSTAAGSAARELLNLSKASVDLANKSAKLYKMQRDTDGKFISNAEYAKKNASTIEDLARSYNPLMAAELAYAKEAKRTAQAVQLNVISESERAASLARTSLALNNAAMAQTRFGQASQIAGHHAANLGYQINDIGMMMALGQNPFALMMQQGPQVAQIFSQMNAEGRKIGPTLVSAFTSLLNPTTAITIALIGGTAALVQWATSAGGSQSKAVELSEAMGRLSEIQSGLKDSGDILSMNLIQLYDKYGLYAVSVRNASVALVELQAAEARAALSDTLLASASAMDRFADATGRGVVVIAQELGVTVGKTVELQAAFRVLRDSITFEDKVSALQGVNTALKAAGVGAEKLPKELRQALIEGQQAAIQMAELQRVTDLAAKAAAAISGNAPKSGWLDGAISGASKLAATLWDAAAAKSAATATAIPSGREGRLATLNANMAGRGQPPKSYGIPETATGTGGGGGGGGGGGSGGGGDNGIQALIQSFQTKAQITDEWYAKNQAMLQAASDQELAVIGGKYAALEALESQYRQKKFEYDQISANMTYQAYAGALGAASDLLSVFAGENKSAAIAVIAIQKGLAIAQIIMNTSVAQMRALAELGPIAGAAMAAKIGIMGKIQAGLVAATGLAQAGQAGNGGGLSGGGVASAATAGTAKVEPTKNILVNLTGPDFLVDMAESIIQQIYDQSKDGRVIVSRG